MSTTMPELDDDDRAWLREVARAEKRERRYAMAGLTPPERRTKAHKPPKAVRQPEATKTAVRPPRRVVRSFDGAAFGKGMATIVKGHTDRLEARIAALEHEVKELRARR